MRILISPFPAKLPSGKLNPKSYPYWAKLVEMLTKEGYVVVQIGVTGEERIAGVGMFIQGWPFKKLRELVEDCETWISVDNFFPHFCNCEQLKSGIVLWGQSDPKIFGYEHNINLLRSREYLRQWQYQSWEAAEHDPNAFVYAENVMQHVYKLAPLPPKELLLTANARAQMA